MSIVTLQLGQCGNQIGGQLFATLMNDLSASGQHCSKAQDADYRELALERFFHRSDFKDPANDHDGNVWKARAVMVDMEPKVIAHSMAEARKSGSWRYPDKQQYCQKRGSGNNWAHGFCVHGPNSKEAIMNMVQKEVEKCDRFGGFLTLLSLAGGTGSGVGAYTTQCLRDEFPRSFIINQVVWPYSMGEVIVQNYNAVLTLAHLYQTADAVLAMDNDSLHKICSQLLAIKAVSMTDINKVICHKLASILLPVYSSRDADTPLRNHLGDLLEQVVAHPEYKLLTLRNIPQISERSLRYSTYQWPGLLKHLRQMLVADAAMEEGINWQIKATAGSSEFNRSVANLLVLRGKDVKDTETSAFDEPQLYTHWVPRGFGCATWRHPRPFNDYERSAVLLSNSHSAVNSLNKVVDRAWTMFSTRAYVHQYLKHGLTEEEMVDSFATLEQVIASYNRL